MTQPKDNPVNSTDGDSKRAWTCGYCIGLYDCHGCSCCKKYKTRPTVAPADGSKYGEIKGRSNRLAAVAACKDRNEIARLLEKDLGKSYLTMLDYVDGIQREASSPTDGDAERALDELIRQATSADRVITAEDENKLIAAEEILLAAIKGDKS